MWYYLLMLFLHLFRMKTVAIIVYLFPAMDENELSPVCIFRNTLVQIRAHKESELGEGAGNFQSHQPKSLLQGLRSILPPHPQHP